MQPSRSSEWDVLKKHHRFVRDDEEPQDVSWEERLARAYESKLFREYALIDLKHFKSKRFALRWRTATEVVEAIGDETCGSLRCPNHKPSTDPADPDSFDPRALRAFELPFAYEEHDARKECLVKVRLCPRCSAKLEWKPHAERDHDSGRDRDRDRVRDRDRERGRDDDGRRTRGYHEETKSKSDYGSRRGRNTSRSPSRGDRDRARSTPRREYK